MCLVWYRYTLISRQSKDHGAAIAKQVISGLAVPPPGRDWSDGPANRFPYSFQGLRLTEDKSTRYEGDTGRSIDDDDDDHD